MTRRPSAHPEKLRQPSASALRSVGAQAAHRPRVAAAPRPKSGKRSSLRLWTIITAGIDGHGIAGKILPRHPRGARDDAARRGAGFGDVDGYTLGHAPPSECPR